MDNTQNGPEDKQENAGSNTVAITLPMDTIPTTSRKRKVSKLNIHKYVVLLSACCVFAIVAGFFLCFGVLFVDLLEFYQATRTETSAVHSVFTAVELSSSLLIGFCVNKYGSRYCGLFGCAMASAGILLGSQCDTISQMQFCIGGVSGLGFALFFLSGINIISQCFEGSARISAISILLAAPSISGIAFPVVLRRLIDVFGLQDTLLLIGTFCLNSLPLSYLWNMRNKLQTKTSIVATNSCASTLNERESSQAESDREDQDIGKIEKSSYRKVFDRRYSTIKRNHGLGRTYNKIDSYGSIYSCKEQFVHNGELNVDYFDPHFDIETNGFFIPNISMMYLPTFPNVALRSAIYIGIVRELLTNVPYIIFAVAQLLTQTCLIVISVFTMDILADNAVASADASLVVLVFNIAGILGRLFPGLVKDSKNLRISPFISVLVATLAGIASSIAIQLFRDLTVLTVSFGVVGFAHGCIVSSNSVTVVSLVRREIYTPAVGSIFGLLGICVAVAGPLNGYLRDTLGSYNTTFYLINVSLVFGFILFLAASVAHQRKKIRLSRQISTRGA